MPRYFVDTNCIVGMTFFHDRWYREVQPLFEHNHVFTSDAEIWEYCVRRDGDPPMPEDPTTWEIKPNDDAGKYGEIRDELNEKLPKIHTKIDRLGSNGLTIDALADAVFEHFKIRDEAKPDVKAALEDYFEDRALIPFQAKRGVRELIDRILYTSEHNKQVLVEAMSIEESNYHQMDSEYVEICNNTDGYIQHSDLCIILDGIAAAQSKLVTGDGGYLHAHHFVHQEWGLSIVWAEQEFYTDDLLFPEEEILGPVPEMEQQQRQD